MVRKILLIIFISMNLMAENNCIDLAFKSYQIKDYKSAIETLKECEHDILQDESDKNIIKYYYGLGKSYLELGRIDSAFKYQLITYNLKNSLEIKDNLNLSLNDLGIIYNKIGLPHKSLYFLNNAININLKKGNKKLLFDNYLNLGVTYFDLNLIDSTKKYYDLAMKQSPYVSNSFISKLYNNFSVLYQRKKQYDKAIFYSKLSIDNYNLNQLSSLKSQTNLELIYLLKDSVNYHNSFESYYRKAKEENSKLHLSDALFKLSLFEKENSEKSISYLKRSIAMLTNEKNYLGALAVLNEYKRFSYRKSLIKSELSSIEKELLALNSKRLAREYGNELKTNEESQAIIRELETELMYSNIGFYGLTFIIILILTIGILINYAFKKYKILNRIIDLIRNKNEYNLSETNNAKSNLGKLTYYLDNRLNYEGNEFLFKTLDDITDNVNNLNVKHISLTNKEAECQILQHQQITHG